MTKLYQLPLRFDLLMERNQELPAAGLEESIRQNIMLIVSTPFNEHRFDDSYGCEIWNRDFELISNLLQWQEQVNKSIVVTLARYEPRLEQIEVDTVITEEPYLNPVTRVTVLKKRITIRVRAKIKATGRDFFFAPQLFLSPISID